MPLAHSGGRVVKATPGPGSLATDHQFATIDGRAQFAAVTYVPVAERVDARFPFRLNTGRLRDQWHGMSRTGTLATLFAHAPEPAVELNPADLARRGLAAGDLVRVNRGAATCDARVAAESGKPGTAFVPMHWGSGILAGRTSTGINAVTAKAFCPSSKQPELKHAAVRIVKVELPWKLVAFGFPEEAAELISLRDEVRARASALDYASVVLIGAERAGVFLRAACAQPMDAAWLADLDPCSGSPLPTRSADDQKRAIGRRVRVDAGRAAVRGPAAWRRSLAARLAGCRRRCGAHAIAAVVADRRGAERLSRARAHRLQLPWRRRARHHGENCRVCRSRRRDTRFAERCAPVRHELRFMRTGIEADDRDPRCVARAGSRHDR